jgi:hypothetical protein
MLDRSFDPIRHLALVFSSQNVASPGQYSFVRYTIADLGFEPRFPDYESGVLPVVTNPQSRWQDLNLQPPVYKTGALPLSYKGDRAAELDPYVSILASLALTTG